MKLGIISDTHDRLPAIRRAMALFKRLEVEAVLHPGDFIAPFAAQELVSGEAPDPDRVPLYCVFGNNDGEREGLKNVLPQVQDGPLRVELGGRTIVMHHWIEWFKPEDLSGADIVLSGHTHQVVNETKDGVMYLNPGECCGWRFERCTVAVLDTDGPSAEIIEVHP